MSTDQQQHSTVRSHYASRHDATWMSFFCLVSFINYNKPRRHRAVRGKPDFSVNVFAPCVQFVEKEI